MKINLLYAIVSYKIIVTHVIIQSHMSITSAKTYEFINHRSSRKKSSLARTAKYDDEEQEENYVNRRRRRRRQWGEVSESESVHHFRSLSEEEEEEEEDIIRALSIAQLSSDDETYHYYNGYNRDYDDYFNDDGIHDINEDYDEQQDDGYDSYDSYVRLSQKKLKRLEKKEHIASIDDTTIPDQYAYNTCDAINEIGLVGSIQNKTVKTNNNDNEREVIEKSYDQTNMEITNTNFSTITQHDEIQQPIIDSNKHEKSNNQSNVRKDGVKVKTTHSFFPPAKLSERKKFHHIPTKSNVPVVLEQPTDTKKSTTTAYLIRQNKIPIEIPSSIDAIRVRAENNARNKKTKLSSLTNTNNNRFTFFTQQQQQHHQQQNAQKYVSMNTNQPSHQLQQDGNKVNSPSSITTTTTSPTTTTGSSSNKTLFLNHNPQEQLLQTKTTTSSKKELKTLNNNRKLLPTTMSLTTPWARKFILSRPKDALLPIPRDFLTDGFNLVQLAPLVERLVTQNDEQQHVHLQQHGHKSHHGKNDSSSSYPSLYKAALRLILDDNESNNIYVVRNVTKYDHSNRTLSSSAATNPTIASTQQQHNPILVQKAAELLYTLVHSRYVTSPRGLDTIRRMFIRNYQIGTKEVVFGRCPRVCCDGNPLLPYGKSCEYDFESVIGDKEGAVASSSSVIGDIQRKSMRYCCSCGEVKVLYMFMSFLK